MGNKAKILIGVYSFAILVGILYSIEYSEIKLNEVDKTIIQDNVSKSFHFVKLIDVKPKEIFDSFSDVKNYPKILPNNILSVKIINQTEVDRTTILFAEEEIFEAGISIKVLAKHTIHPLPLIHNIEVMNGDAKGTTITQKFKELESGTEVSTEIVMRVKGILIPFVFLPEHNVKHAMESVIESFSNYTIHQINN